MRDAAKQAQEKAESASRAKSILLANMSRELHTLLNASIGYSEMLQEVAADMSPAEMASAHLRRSRRTRARSSYIANTHGRANMFAALFVGALDPATGTIACVNGGHEPPRVIRAKGMVRTMLPPTGPAAGMPPEIPFTAGTIMLEPGETPLVLTDGITGSARRMDCYLVTTPRTPCSPHRPIQRTCCLAAYLMPRAYAPPESPRLTT